jgi:hypothetical protein
LTCAPVQPSSLHRGVALASFEPELEPAFTAATTVF